MVTVCVNLRFQKSPYRSQWRDLILQQQVARERKITPSHLSRVSPSTRGTVEQGQLWKCWQSEEELGPSGFSLLCMCPGTATGQEQKKLKDKVCPTAPQSRGHCNPSPSTAEHWKNHTSPWKSCHPHLTSSFPCNSHTSPLFHFLFFFRFSHNIFKNNIDHVILVHNNTNQCKPCKLWRSLVQVYL